MPGARDVSRRRPMLDRRVVLDYRRRRIVVGASAACAETGYRDLTIEDVVRHAGVSRTSIYKQYENKEAIFIDLLQTGAAELRAAAEAACEAAGPDEQGRVDAALGSVLAWVADNPDSATALLCEADAAGAAAARVKGETIDWFAAQLEGRLAADSSPPRAAELVTGGVASILAYRAYARDTAAVPDLLPSLLAFVARPFEGG